MYFDLTKPAFITASGGDRFPIRVTNERSVCRIKNVIFNNPATIVFWSDGTKTVVKVQDGEVFDREKGLAMAIAKKHFGNEGNYCNHLKKWLKDET